MGSIKAERDGRGALVHLRRVNDDECLACVEVAVYELIRAIVIEEILELDCMYAEALRQISRVECSGSQRLGYVCSQLGPDEYGAWPDDPCASCLARCLLGLAAALSV